MKKTITLLTVLVVALLTLQASAAMYIVGDGPFGGWTPSGGVEMTSQGSRTYTYSATVNGAVYFVFADGGPDAWSNDWTAFNSTYRYGPTATTTIGTGTLYSTAKRNNNYSYYFTGDGSEYLFTFDADNLTFRLDVIEPQPVILLGDVNGNGIIDIADAIILIDYILGQDVTEFNAINADVDQSGNYTINDVTSLIDIILEQ